MKKSLLALAVLTALVGGAHAQSSVTLYGKIDVGGVLDSGAPLNPTGPNGKSLRVSSGVSGGSRLGFKGVEDLGGGLKAGFQIETGFCADSNGGDKVSATTPTGKTTTDTLAQFCTGGNNFMGRQAHVDLSGAFGSVTAGRQYTLAFLNITTVDPFGTGLAGQSTNLFDAGGSSLSNPRVNNSVIYTTPNLSGFTAALLFGAGEAQGDWRTNRTAGANMVYANGPLYVGAAFNDINGTAGVLGRKNTNIGGTYDFGGAKLALLAQATKAGGAANAYTDTRDYLAGVTVPIGSASIMASYIRHDDRTTLNMNADQIGIGAMYALSKRTSLYTAFARIKNEHGALFTVGNATESGTGNKAFNLGVVHNF